MFDSMRFINSSKNPEGRSMSNEEARKQIDNDIPARSLSDSAAVGAASNKKGITREQKKRLELYISFIKKQCSTEKLLGGVSPRGASPRGNDTEEPITEAPINEDIKAHIAEVMEFLIAKTEESGNKRPRRKLPPYDRGPKCKPTAPHKKDKTKKPELIIDSNTMMAIIYRTVYYILPKSAGIMALLSYIIFGGFYFGPRIAIIENNKSAIDKKHIREVNAGGTSIMSEAASITCFLQCLAWLMIKKPQILYEDEIQRAITAFGNMPTIPDFIVHAGIIIRSIGISTARSSMERQGDGQKLNLLTKKIKKLDEARDASIQNGGVSVFHSGVVHIQCPSVDEAILYVVMFNMLYKSLPKDIFVLLTVEGTMYWK